MPTFDTLYDAGCYTLAALLLGAITMLRRRDLRAGTVHLIVLMVIAFGLLVALYNYGQGLANGPFATAGKETLLALIAIGFTRVLVTFIFQALLRKKDLPRILADVLFVLVLIAYAIYRLHVAGVNPTSLGISAAAIGTGVAFSLKDALANIWGGIAVQLDNTARVGDWVRLDNNNMGQIIDIRLRYLAVATNAGETIIVPNASVVAGRLVVLARRGDHRIPWRREIVFHVVYDVRPSLVISTVQAALERVAIPNVATSPPILVTLREFGDSGIGYVVLYGLTDLRLDLATDSLVRVHLHAALTRAGMEVPYPHMVLLRKATPEGSALAERKLSRREQTLASVDLFAPLTDNERRALAAELADCMFVPRDLISRKGEAAEGLYVLAEGTVGIYGDADPTTGTRPHLATLHAPNYFGEMGLLTGQARMANVVAESDVLCYRLDKAGFDAILRARPELVDLVSAVVARRQAANDATLAADADARARMAVSRASELVRRIRQFFDLGQ